MEKKQHSGTQEEREVDRQLLSKYNNFSVLLIFMPSHKTYKNCRTSLDVKLCTVTFASFRKYTMSFDGDKCI